MHLASAPTNSRVAIRSSASASIRTSAMLGPKRTRLFAPVDTLDGDKKRGLLLIE
jgi:hypothetical protein